MYKKINCWTVKIILVMFILTSQAAALNNKTGKIGKDMRIELDMHEKILQQILGHHDEDHAASHHIHSFYIDGYGALFTARGNITTDLIRSENLLIVDESKFEWNEKDGLIVKVKPEKNSIDKAGIKAEVKEVSKMLRLAVFEFLANYFSKVKMLKDSEKVTVHLDLNLHRIIKDKISRSEAKSLLPAAMQLTVAMDQLRAYRKNKIDENTLDKKIDQKLIYSEADDYSFSILSKVFETGINAIEKKGHKPFSVKASFIYFKEFGAVYFIDSGSFPFFIPYGTLGDISLIREDHKFSDFFKQSAKKTARMKKDDIDYQELISIMKNRLVRLIGEYGTNLDMLTDEQWLVTVVQAAASWPQDQSSSFVIKARKKDIDAFSQEKIDLKQFKEKIFIFEETL